MNFIESLELNSPSLHERELKVTLNNQIVDQEFANTVSLFQRNAVRKGFRPGKMPRNMVLNFYGSEIKEKLIEKLVEKSFAPACEKEDVDPVSKPQFEPLGSLEQNKSFTYRASFQVKPKVPTPEYKGLAISIPKYTFSEVDVDNEINDHRANMATFVEPTDRDAIVDDDLVQCDSQVKVDGEINDAYSHNDYSVPLFAENIPADLRAALVGKKIGDVASVNYTMPADEQDEVIAGKVCEMLLTIKSFKSRVLPNVDDDFAKDLSDKFSTLEELKETIRQRFTITVKRREAFFKQDAIMKALVEKNPLDVPPALVERMSLSLINREIEAMDRKLADDIVKNHWAELWHSVQDRAQFRTKAELLLESLIKSLAPTVDDDEVAYRLKAAKDKTKEDILYSMQVEKILQIIESEAVMTVVEEPLFKEGK